MEKSVELGEGLAALGPQGVRRIQNRRNPLLLVEGREGDLERGDVGFRHLKKRCPSPLRAQHRGSMVKPMP